MNDATMMQKLAIELEPNVREATRDARCARLLRDNLDFIARTLRRLGVAEADVEDATQRVFVVAADRLDHIEADRERSFLFGTAKRIAMATRRTRTARLEEPEEAASAVADPSPDPEQALGRRRARQLLDEILDAMPMELREIFVMYELEQLTMAEIATLVEVPAGTVASRLRRARELFQEATNRLRARRTP